jgi:septation ring formation regulator EzrA
MATVHDESFPAYLAQVKAKRAELHESFLAVDEALDTSGERTDWLQRLHTALLELAHDFTDHVDLAERPGGLHETVVRHASRLSPAVQRLAEDHRTLHEELAAIIHRLEESAVEDLDPVRADLTGLVYRLLRHRQRGGELIYEAFGVDLGGGD